MDEQTQIKKIEAALKKQNYLSAQSALLELYRKKPTFKLNYLLFLTYRGLNDANMATQIAEEQLSEYLTDNYCLELYLQEKIKAGRMLETEILLKQLQPYMKTGEKKHFSALLVQSYRKYQEKNAAVLATCQKQFKHLGGYEPHEQENIFKKALMLDQKTYVLLAQRVLQDEDVRPLLRANTFLNLKHLAVTKAVSVINPVNLIMQQIIPAEVQEITASSSFQALKKYLEDDQQVPEDFKDNYLQDFQFKMMLLYPFYTELDLAESRILYDSFVGKNQTQLSKWLQKAILAV